MKLWGGRFEAGPSEIFERFSGSLDFDRRLIDADIRGSQAFARALERAGILSADERAAIVAAFDAIRAESATPAFYEGATDEDVHTLVERLLYEEVGAVAGKLHTGRSRNDQVATDLRLWTLNAIDQLDADLAALGRTVLARAPEAECVVLAELDFAHQDRVRASLPALSHRRTEILGL